MSPAFDRVGVLGGGAWGAALAHAARRAGRSVTLWARAAATAQAIAAGRGNPVYLPGIALAEGVGATSDLADLRGSDLILLAAPAQHLRTVAAQARDILDKDLPPLVICAKGIEQAGDGRREGALMSEALAETCPGAPWAVLSGPSFAAEVAQNRPTAITLAAADPDLGARIVATLGSRAFRPYLSTDPVGVQIGGAVKNVMAIACGIVAGRGLGDNARAALITRGLAEIVRLGAVMGARPETMMGLSGLGDLTLTCTGSQSRNMTLGIALGRGETLANAMAGRRSVVEGVHTAGSVAALAARHGVETPIIAAVNAILRGDASIDLVIQGLLSRPFRQE